MTTWTELLSDVDGEPVRGRSHQFSTAVAVTRRTGEATAAAADEFGRTLAASSVGELSGATARQLATLVGDIDGSFAELPAVFRSLEDVLDTHGRLLDNLDAAAATALATARTRWLALRAAEDHEADRNAALEHVERQLRTLRGSASSPEEFAELERLDVRRRDRRRQLQVAGSARADAEHALQESAGQWRRLRDDEDELVQRTVDALRGIELGDLRDPGALSSLLSSVAGWTGDLVVGLVTSVIATVEAAMDGRFLDALHHLSEVLEHALTILTVVGIAMAIFTTGGSAIAIAGLIVSGAKVGVDGVLAGTGHPHPDTGRPVTWGEVVVEAGLLAVSTATAGASRGASAGERLTGLNGRAKRSVVGNIRQILQPVSGAGAPIHGAARASSVARSWRELATVGVDITDDWQRERAEDALGRTFAAPALTTRWPDWHDAKLINHARSAPATAATRRNIDGQIRAVRSGVFPSPPTSTDAGNFQLAAVPE